MSHAYFKPLKDAISKDCNIREWTIETNPFIPLKKSSPSHSDLFQIYSNEGVHRITLGAQSLNPKVLKFLGRHHSPKDILQSLKSATDAQISQIQVDIIYGHPLEESPDSLRTTIQTLKNNGATGVSLYALTPEMNTHYSNLILDEDKAAREYEILGEECIQQGFIPWEASNFTTQPCLHNFNYWKNRPYIGLGTGACGFTPTNKHYRVGPPLSGGNAKLHDFTEEELFTVHWESSLTSEEQSQERLLTQIRLWEGITLNRLQMNSLKEDPRIREALNQGLMNTKEIASDKLNLRLYWKEQIRHLSWVNVINHKLKNI